MKLGYVRIIQPIDILEIHQIILNFDEIIKSNNYNNQLYRLLVNKNSLLYQTYLKLIPHEHRIKRWDSIGKVIKWIAGTPDADDLKLINKTMDELTTSNNQQVLFNTALNSKINHLNQITNELLQLDFKSKQQHVIELNLLTIISNIDVIQHQLEVLEDAIILAKKGIPSSQIFSMKDFLKIKAFLKQQQIPVTSFENLLTKASTQIAINDTHVIYMLKIPQLSTEVFSYEFINPLIQDEKQIHIQSNYIIINKTHVYEAIKQCEEESEYYICEPDLMKLSSQCINNLIRLQHANCTYEKAYNIGIIKRINEATILLNNVNVTLQTNCTNNTQHLEGSYLIHFEQCEIYLDNDHYINMAMEIPKRMFRPTTGIIAIEDHIIDIPPPEVLANLTMIHRSMLQHVYLQNNSLRWKLHTFGSISFLTLSLIAGMITLYIIKMKWQRETTKIEVNLNNKTPSAPEEYQLTEKLPRSPYPDVSDERFRELVNYLNTPTSARPI